MRTPLVSICCITYNHEPYIKQCLKGILMQKCDFEYEIIVHDDASTDKTQAIIKAFQKKYSHKITTVLQKENQWSKSGGALFAQYVLPKVKGKYIAMCEGDDWWVDPFKLQKQIDFLEKNVDYILTCGAYINRQEGKEDYLTIRGNKLAPQKETAEGFSFSLEDNSTYWMCYFVSTLTMVFRNKRSVFEKASKYKYSRDVHLVYHLLLKGKGFYFNDILGVYRKHQGGIYSLKSKFEKNKLGYIIYKELYYKNRDKYSKTFYRRWCLRLLSTYHPEHKIKGEISRKKLIRETIPLLENKKDIALFIRLIVPKRVKSIKKRFLRSDVDKRKGVV